MSGWTWPDSNSFANTVHMVVGEIGAASASQEYARLLHSTDKDKDRLESHRLWS